MKLQPVLKRLPIQAGFTCGDEDLADGRCATGGASSKGDGLLAAFGYVEYPVQVDRPAVPAGGGPGKTL